MLQLCTVAKGVAQLPTVWGSGGLDRHIATCGFRVFRSASPFASYRELMSHLTGPLRQLRDSGDSARFRRQKLSDVAA